MAERVKISKGVVDALEPGEKDRFVWDKDIRGFGVKVTPKGRRIYVLQYRNEAGREKRFTIGRHGDLTAEEARARAKELRAQVTLGDDPHTEKVDLRRGKTVAELCDEYMQAAEAGLIYGKQGRAKKASTLVTDRHRIESIIKPVLGARKVADLRRRDIKDFVETVTQGARRLGGNATGGPGAAARTKGLLSGILSWAVEKELIESNPAFGVKVAASGRRDFLMRPEHYAALGKALSETPATPHFYQIVWLLALTGCRRSEILGLKWTEVDTVGKALRLGDTKTGQSVRPISERALAILGEIKPEAGTPYVFPAKKRGSGHIGGFKKAYQRFAELSGLPGEITPHVLRHGFASVAAELGYSDTTIAALIGHSRGTVTSRYIHHLDEVLIAAANRTAETIFERMHSGT